MNATRLRRLGFEFAEANDGNAEQTKMLRWIWDLGQENEIFKLATAYLPQVNLESGGRPK